MKERVCVCIYTCIYIYITDSLCCTAETNTKFMNQLYTNKNFLEKKKKKPKATNSNMPIKT